MKKTMVFASRNTKEIVRDPISLFFGIAFPVILLLLLSLINNSIPAEAEMTLFEVSTLAPGIAIFSLSFITLFAAMLISKDRGSCLFMRLLSSPLRGSQYILGYALPLIPMALLQMLVCFAAAIPLGLRFTPRLFAVMGVSLPIILVYIACGILCGTLFNEKAVGGICGALFTNLSAWFSGIWFSLDLIGGVFKKIAYFLPFAHAVDAARSTLTGNYADAISHILPICIWAAVLTAAAVIIFRLKMRNR